MPSIIKGKVTFDMRNRALKVEDTYGEDGFKHLARKAKDRASGKNTDAEYRASFVAQKANRVHLDGLLGAIVRRDLNASMAALKKIMPLCISDVELQDAIYDRNDSLRITAQLRSIDYDYSDAFAEHHYCHNDKSINNLLYRVAMLALEKNAPKTIKKLVNDFGFNINTVHNGRTILYQAAVDQLWSLVKKLVGLGADPSITDEHGCTPLYPAAYYKQDTVVELLLVKGACPRQRDEHGVTPYDCALDNDGSLSVKGKAIHAILDSYNLIVPNVAAIITQSSRVKAKQVEARDALKKPRKILSTHL